MEAYMMTMAANKAYMMTMAANGGIHDDHGC